MSVRAHVRAGGSPATVTLTGPATSIPLACVFEGVAHDSLRSLAGEDNRLDSDLIGCAAAQATADAGVLALRVFAHADHVDLGRALADERARDAWQQAHRAEIDILVEALA